MSDNQAITDLLLQRGQGNVDVQIGGPGNNWIYLSACAAMTGPDVPSGDFESRWCQDTLVAGGFKRSSKIRTAPDLITFDLTTKLGKVNYLKRLGCTFSQRARYALCGEREDPANYDPLMLNYCNAGITGKSYEDLAVTDPGNNDEIMVTSNVSADYEYEIRKLGVARSGASATALNDQAINDIEYCDSKQCGGYCAAESDGCTKIYGVTQADNAPYATPYLIKGVKDLNTGAITWSNAPILGLNSNVQGIECAGKRLIVSSNGDSAIAYNDTDGGQNDWVVVPLTRVPANSHNALFALNGREIWLGCVGGYILKSVNGGLTWTEVHSATLTTQNILAVWAYDKNLVYAAGAAGVILKSEDGGQTWADKTETTTIGSPSILAVVVPPNRPKEVYVGTNNGRIWRSINGGDDFTRVFFAGDSVGTIDDIAFSGPCAGDVMFILHNDAGPRARILRDLSGGAGGVDVEVVMNYFQVIATGIDLNALSVCDPNEFIAAGENYGGFPVVVRGS